MRTYQETRNTNETKVTVSINLDGSGKSNIDTGYKFFNHMLEQVACHPMDEALVMTVVDISGRPFSKTMVDLNDEKTSDFETVLLPHFFNSFAQNALLTLHIRMLDGTDTHHIIEAAFKSFARALREAVSICEKSKDVIPSTKGII